MSITKIVITGGPCSGKTTGMSYLRDKLSNLGYRVFIVPEIATEIITGGFNSQTATRDELMRFEERLIRSQIFHENIADEFARELDAKGEKVIILSDRGTMDARAYVDSDEYEAILNSLSETTTSLRDKNYDAVIHMVTVANGAPEFYTLDNNQARQETSLDEAISACNKTMKAWVGHPHLRIVDNSTDFEGKIRRTYQEICQVLGIPVPLEKERKFLVSSYCLPESLPMQVIDIEQVYLLSSKNGIEERVRKRGQDGSYVYYHTIKTPTDKPDTRQEQERQISSYEYAMAVQNDADPTKVPIVKQRHCFLWHNIYYELDAVKSPKKVKLLEIELTGDSSNLEIPSFINIAREVTGNKNYNNFNLARR